MSFRLLVCSHQRYINNLYKFLIRERLIFSITIVWSKYVKMAVIVRLVSTIHILIPVPQTITGLRPGMRLLCMLGSKETPLAKHMVKMARTLHRLLKHAIIKDSILKLS